jgi:prepilin-type N-terminal cleavage/methylation domain-containing protein
VSNLTRSAPLARIKSTANQRSDRNTARAGVTMLELLVAMGVISLLMSLLIPAVLSARTAARSTQCRNNLHQVGIAAQSFHASHGYISAQEPLKSLLPLMGETALAERLAAQDSEGLSSPAFLICPDDFVADRGRLDISYALNRGHSFSKDGRGRGIEWWGRFRFVDATDGLSNTAYMSEKLVWLDLLGRIPVEEGRRNPLRYSFETLVSYSEGDEDAFAMHCLSGEVRRQVSVLGEWHQCSLVYDQWVYDHLLPPNSWSFSNRRSDPWDGISRTGGAAAGSLHSNGVHILRLDGSVKFTYSGIDLAVYRGMGSIAGGESSE